MAFIGTHVLIYSSDAEATPAAYGTSWLHAMSLMCDDIHATVRDLRAKGIQVAGEPEDHGYGITVMVTSPGGVEIQVYEPSHPLAIDAT